MARTGMILLPGARARTVAMRREGCGDDGVAEDDGIAKEEDGVVEEVVEDEVGVMLLVSMHLKGCRVQPGCPCGERPGNVERKEEVEVGTERVVQPRP